MVNLRRLALQIKLHTKGKVMTPVDICQEYIKRFDRSGGIIRGSATMGTEKIEYYFVKVGDSIIDIVGEFTQLNSKVKLEYTISEEWSPDLIHDDLTREKYSNLNKRKSDSGVPSG
jgi:hypothetical protein